MDFKIIPTTHGDMLLRRDTDGEQDELVIHFFTPKGHQITMKFDCQSATAVQLNIFKADAEWAEDYVKKQVLLTD